MSHLLNRLPIEFGTSVRKFQTIAQDFLFRQRLLFQVSILCRSHFRSPLHLLLLLLLFLLIFVVVVFIFKEAVVGRRGELPARRNIRPRYSSSSGESDITAAEFVVILFRFVPEVEQRRRYSFQCGAIKRRRLVFDLAGCLGFLADAAPTEQPTVAVGNGHGRIRKRGLLEGCVRDGGLILFEASLIVAQFTGVGATG